jgi:hypothetical protein
MTVNTHTKMLDEILDSIDKSESPISDMRIAMGVPYFRNYMELAVNDNWTTVDMGEVDITKYEYHRSMAGTRLLNRNTWSVVDGIIMKPEVAKRTKRVQFKSLCEMLFSGEAEIFKAILRKDLTSLYPNITFDVINKGLDKNETV